MDLDGPQKPYIEWGLDLPVDRVLFWGVILGLACIRYTECCQHLAMHLLLPLKFFCNAVCFPSLIKDNFRQVLLCDSVSRLFVEILNKEVNCTEIQFTEDGNWRAMRPDSDEYFIPDSPSTNASHCTAPASESVATGKFRHTYSTIVIY